MSILKKNNLFILLVIIVSFNGCREIYTPKPKGHFRIDLPAKEYAPVDTLLTKSSGMPFTFEYPLYGKISVNMESKAQPGWFNLEFPEYRAKIYFTYKKINNDFESLMEQSYKMNVKNHITKADAINEHVINNQKNNVYGILYDLKGNTASAVQFYVSDTVHHFLRGSLYFASEPDADSLAPVIDFFREDMIHIIETLKWKY